MHRSGDFDDHRVIAQAQADGVRIDVDDIYVKEVFVNAGPMMKRILPAPMGRAYRVKKRSNHLTIFVATKE